MRKVLFAAVATVVLSAPFAASADEVTVRDQPNGNVTVREHGAPPRDDGRVVIKEHERAPETVIKERVGPDNITIKDR